jgi:8-oxo-dGTP diphosphatase
MTRSKRQVKGTVAFDWDGVLSEGGEYHWPLTGLDLTLIHEAHARGYAAAVMTCNDVRLVAAELRRHGIKAAADIAMARCSWHDPVAVLVTGRKISADLYVDDRAVNYRYGQPAEIVLGALDEAGGYHPCPQGRHWGPYGAAGVLPFTVFRGRLYVLLGLRSRHVNAGGCWGGFGGALEYEHEDTWKAAQRELCEEVSGLDGGMDLTWADYYAHECEGCGWRYVTFTAEVATADPGEDGGAWLPEARVSTGHSAWETDRVRWVRAEDVAGYKLHPGFAEAWPSLRRSLERFCGLELAA